MKGDLSMEYKAISFKKTEVKGVAELRLLRSKKLNSLDDDMFYELQDVIHKVKFDDSVKVLLILGEGKGFCAGADLSGSSIIRSGGAEATILLRKYHDNIVLNLRKMNKIVIAALNGIAVGGGLGIALACDIRIASEAFRLGVGFTKLGAVSDFGNAYFLPRLIGTAKAIELYFVKDIISAKEALQLGLVSEVVPENELYKVSMDYAMKIAEGPSFAIGLAKELIYRGSEMSLESILQSESVYQAISFTTPDFKEGVSAVREKRKPQFGTDGY